MYVYLLSIEGKNKKYNCDVWDTVLDTELIIMWLLARMVCTAQKIHIDFKSLKPLLFGITTYHLKDLFVYTKTPTFSE